MFFVAILFYVFVSHSSRHSYGFLSENANFCEKVNQISKFLGPSASAIRQLGDKLESKRLAASAGVNIVPGHDEPVATLDEAIAMCGTDAEIPYPVLVKVCFLNAARHHWVSRLHILW